jgi:hypothetical protein
MNINVYPEENICRFCLESENPERLIVACRCSGTMKYVHDYCLIKWTNTTTNAEARNKCITCGYTYKKVPPRTYCLKHFCSAIQYSPFLIFLHNFLVSLFFATPCTMYLLVDYKYKYSVCYFSINYTIFVLEIFYLLFVFKYYKIKSSKCCRSLIKNCAFPIMITASFSPLYFTGKNIIVAPFFLLSLFTSNFLAFTYRSLSEQFDKKYKERIVSIETEEEIVGAV